MYNYIINSYEEMKKMKQNKTCVCNKYLCKKVEIDKKIISTYEYDAK